MCTLPKRLDYRCKLRSCNMPIGENYTKVEVRTKMPCQKSLCEEKMAVQWMPNGEAMFHLKCWTLVLKSSRTLRKKKGLIHVREIEKRMVKEAAKTFERHDGKDKIEKAAKQLAEMLLDAKHACVFTGAGISTSAGIGDYRGKSGKWTEEDRALCEIDIDNPETGPVIHHPKLADHYKHTKAEDSSDEKPITGKKIRHGTLNPRKRNGEMLEDEPLVAKKGNIQTEICTGGKHIKVEDNMNGMVKSSEELLNVNMKISGLDNVTDFSQQIKETSNDKEMVHEKIHIYEKQGEGTKEWISVEKNKMNCGIELNVNSTISAHVNTKPEPPENVDGDGKYENMVNGFKEDDKMEYRNNVDSYETQMRGVYKYKCVQEQGNNENVIENNENVEKETKIFTEERNSTNTEKVLSIENEQLTHGLKEVKTENLQLKKNIFKEEMEEDANVKVTSDVTDLKYEKATDNSHFDDDTKHENEYDNSSSSQEETTVEPSENNSLTENSSEGDSDSVEYEMLRPTYTHEALVELQRRNLLRDVISQNGDGLHSLSGVKEENLFELHGNVFIERCERCNTRYHRPYYVLDDEASQYYEEIEEFGSATVKKPKHAVKCVTCGLNHRTGRNCTKQDCNGALLDTIINFGDNLEEHILTGAEKTAEKADLMLCLGTTLQVTPANSLVTAGDAKEKLVIVNRQKTHLDYLANIRVFGDCDAFMQAVLHHLIPSDALRRWEESREERMRVYASERQES